MKKKLQPPSNKVSAGDCSLAVTKAVVGAIPFIGAAANELIDITVIAPAQKRQAVWQERMTTTINKLVNEIEGITPESLAKNDVFLDAVISTSRIAMATSRLEKIQMLQSVIYRTGSGFVLEETVRNTFLWIVERYTPEHVWLLKELNSPQSIQRAFERLRVFDPGKINLSEMEADRGEFAKVENIAKYMLPDIGTDIARELFTDLHRDSLCHGSEGFAYSVYLENPVPIVTDRGIAFLNFVML